LQAIHLFCPCATAGLASGQGPRAVWIVSFVILFGDSND
jgi:hypothetical protein